MIRSLLLGALILVSAAVGRAQLVLSINTTAKTLSFSGSTSGDSTANTISWYDTGSGSLGAQLISPPSTYLTVTGATSGNLQVIGYSTGDGLRIRFIGTEITTGVTIAGTGTEFNYSSFNDGTKTILENHIGQTLNLENGSGFSSLSIVAASSVPEPGTYAVILGGFAFAGVAYARLRRRALR